MGTSTRAQASTEAMLLGTLVHRAVSMPFQKPWKIDDGGLVVRRGGKPREGIGAAIVDAAEDLAVALYPADKCEVERLTAAVAALGLSGPLASRVLRSIEECDAGGIGEAIIDSGGRWWAAAAEGWRRQGDDVRAHLLDEMQVMAARIGEALEQRAREHEWTHLWAEASIIEAVDSDGLTLRRPDITAFSLNSDWTEVELVELKTSRGKRVSVESIEKGIKELRDAASVYRDVTSIRPSMVLLLAPAEGEITWQKVGRRRK